MNEVPQWLPVDGTSAWVAALAHHAYDYPTDAMLGPVAALGARADKPTWMTEICCYDGAGPLVGFGAQYDPTMTSGIWLADTIWQDLTVAGDSAFYWWTALSSQLGCRPVSNPRCPVSVNSQGWNDGLLYYDPSYRSDGNHRLYPTKRLWVMGNFSRYVRPGAVRHDLSGAPPGTRALAFSDGGRWTLVVVDDRPAGSAPVRIGVDLPVTRASPTGGALTDQRADLAPARPVLRSGPSSFVATVGARSVTTLTFRPVPRA
ncbi:MAG: hypothetical protein ACREDE_11355 [Thermoplasmata archaeon]